MFVQRIIKIKENQCNSEINLKEINGKAFCYCVMFQGNSSFDNNAEALIDLDTQRLIQN